VLLPIAGRLGARCALDRAGKGEPVAATAVSWGPGGLVALVAGQPVAFAVDLVPDALLRVVNRYQGERRDGEEFSNWARRTPNDELLSTLEGAS